MGWKQWKMKTGKENRNPESRREIQTRKTEIEMGDCAKSDIERVIEEWSKRATEGTGKSEEETRDNEKKMMIN